MEKRGKQGNGGMKIENRQKMMEGEKGKIQRRKKEGKRKADEDRGMKMENRRKKRKMEIKI